MTLQAFAPTVVYVSKARILGANYGMMAAIPIANGGIEAPAFGLNQPISAGLADSYFVPFSLGWHTPDADINTAFRLFAPTGRYTAGASDNIGKDMWSFELSAGIVRRRPLEPIEATRLAFRVFRERGLLPPVRRRDRGIPLPNTGT